MNEGDTYGLVTNDYLSVDPYWSSCEVNIVQKDADGKYVNVFDVGRLENVCTELIRLFYDSGATYVYPHNGSDLEQQDIRKTFANGQAAMATMRLLELETGEIRNMSDSYGIVPMPKLTTEHKDYHTLLHDQFTVFAIPNTVTGDRFQEIGAVLEALCVESYRNVTPAYYETALKYKYMCDPESWNMLDIVINNIHIDAGIIYTLPLNSFHSGFREVMQSKRNTVSSKFKKASTTLNRKLPTLIENIKRVKSINP